MTSNFGGIAIREPSILSSSSWVPTAFYNCSPEFSEGVQSQGAQAWLAGNASSPLTSRPLIAASGSSSTSGSSGSSSLFS